MVMFHAPLMPPGTILRRDRNGRPAGLYNDQSHKAIFPNSKPHSDRVLEHSLEQIQNYHDNSEEWHPDYAEQVESFLKAGEKAV